MKKAAKRIALFSFLLVVGFGVWFNLITELKPPVISNNVEVNKTRVKLDTNFYQLEANRLRKNKYGLWEMYLTGKPFERGVAHGILAKEQAQYQEDHFINQIQVLIPSKFYLRFLKYFVSWFNRNLAEHIPLEYQQEIFGVAQSFKKGYDFIGTPYHRILNYHAAHDIGHALQGKGMVVGCTSFSSWGEASLDGKLIIGRNFDFYAGDGFSKNKFITFMNPDSGYKFMSVGWAGMCGVLSGMNEHGLTVTINAGGPEVPSTAATPISVLTREILQYALNIEQAIEIAKKRETFVAESIMIGSAQDGKTILIEKSPSKMAIYDSEQNSIVCSNHFQADAFKEDEWNKENIRTSDSPARYQRVKELMQEKGPLSLSSAAHILRDRKGSKGEELGMGSQKAINQLQAHHAVIFKPADRLAWVSTPPYQLGQFICYDLNKVFDNFAEMEQDQELLVDSLSLPIDSFLLGNQYKKYTRYRKLKTIIKTAIHQQTTLDTNLLLEFEQINPHHFYVFELLGDYAATWQQNLSAYQHYEKSLTRVIPTQQEKQRIEEKLAALSYLIRNYQSQQPR